MPRHKQKSAKISVNLDPNGRLDKVSIQEGSESPLTVQYAYPGNAVNMVLTSTDDVLPSYADLLKIIDAKYGEYVRIISGMNILYNPATGQNEAQRTPTVFPVGTNVTAAGATLVWTPAAGKSFRLMGALLILSKDAASAGDVAWSFYEFYNPWLPGHVVISTGALVAMGVPVVINLVFQGNGYLSFQPNNVLKILMDNALTAGNLSVSVWGTEE